MPQPVSDVSKFKDITATEVSQLSDAGLITRELVWAAVEKEGGSGISAIVEKTGIGKARLAAWLVEDALDEAKYLSMAQDKVSSRVIRGALASLGRHWLDISVAVGIVLLGFLAYRAASAQQAYSIRVVVTKSGGLPAFQAVTRDDVSMQKGKVSAGTFTKLEDVLGRFSTEPISQGTVVRAECLRSDPGLLAELSRRLVLQITIKSSLPSPDSKIPHRVWLLAAPRLDAKVTQPQVLKDVFLLAVVRDGDSTRASIAVLPDQLMQLGALIGSADVFVVYPVPQ